MKMIGMFVAAAVAAAGIAAPASSAIVLGTLSGGNLFTRGGAFVLTDAAITPVVGTNAVNTFNVYGLNEQRVTLASNLIIAANPIPPGTVPVTISAGTTVESHLVFVDPAVGVNNNIANGTVTFSSRILGVVWRTAQLSATNALFGADGVTYTSLNGLEPSFLDAVTFSGKTLTYNFSTTPSSSDFIRVITAVPEPQTWAMLVMGFGLVGLATRRRRTAIVA
ncbi:hypothetical protein GCM10011529_23990 [Polymorphobacter glacialis]|uniref:Ice-binding protein C-terminal domain-containing protein n=1 Tax=Sandarakinorhabdus glacialis TaxID=1614636 RepID=A0A917E9R0_9SPHN|nr:PEPxxWA-CTERM sorting domain-containing protein [Polymorphobacter glacialis]GGE16765.1 hypothetical protein GCM10011529_23990 [Polymorphobacter glacialis]